MKTLLYFAAVALPTGGAYGLSYDERFVKPWRLSFKAEGQGAKFREIEEFADIDNAFGRIKEVVQVCIRNLDAEKWGEG